MKYLVEIAIRPEIGNKLEKKDPGALFGRLFERFKPETVYMAVSARDVFMVADLEPTDLAELMIIGANMSGDHPKFTPVVPGNEFGDMLGKAMPSAMKILGD